MNIFPLISSPVSDLGTELPLAREVRWDFTEDKPIWHGGNPATVTGSEAVLVWAWNTLNTSRYLDITGTAMTWYWIAGGIAVGGIVAYVAMNGYDGLYEDLLKHLHGLAGKSSGNV